MGRPKENSGGGLSAGTIAFIVFIVAIIGYFTYEAIRPSDDPILSRQLDSKEALIAYIEQADGFMADRSTFEDIRKCVTEEDYDWFQNTADGLFKKGDIYGLSTAADPTVMAAVARRTVMEMLLQEGPYRKDSVILEGSESGDTAQYKVRKKEIYSDGYTLYYDVKVYLVKQGRYWKVKDFGGGRAEVENRRKPDDVVALSQEEVEGSGNSDTTTPPPAQQQQQQPVAVAAPPSAPPPSVPGNNMNNVPNGNSSPGQPAMGMPGATAPPAKITINAKALPTLENANELLTQAQQAWSQQDYSTAYAASERAYAIRLHHLGANDQRVFEVQKMAVMARQQLAIQQQQQQQAQ